MSFIALILAVSFFVQSAIRALMPLMSQPGMISLGGGLPNDKMFPFTGSTPRHFVCLALPHFVHDVLL